MILILVYLWAGLTIGRMCYEWDIFAASEAEEPLPIERRQEISLCWVVGFVWPIIMLYAIWIHVSNPRSVE